MSQRADYTDDEWFILWRAVANVPPAIMVAHPAHLVREAFVADAALEHVARTCKSMVGMLLAPPRSEAEWLSHRLDLQRRSEGQRDADEFMNETLDDCRQAVALLGERGNPEELKEYQQGLFEIAVAVAKAGKEGGFWGIGGVAMDESEKVFLRDLAEALGLEWDGN